MAILDKLMENFRRINTWSDDGDGENTGDHKGGGDKISEDDQTT